MDTSVESAVTGKPLPRLGWPALAVRLALKHDPLALFEHGFRRHGEVVLYDTGKLRYCVLASPAAAEHVLVKAHKNYYKAAAHPVLERLLGEGMIMTNGDRWRMQRKRVAPAFQPRALGKLVAATSEEAARIAGEWAARDDERIDVYAELTNLTRRLVSRSLFGEEVGATGELSRLMDTLVDRANVRAEPWYPAPMWLPIPRNRLFQRAADALDAEVARIIADHRRAGDRDTVLGFLMKAHEESGLDRMEDQELRDQILNLYFAGFETTTASLIWTTMLLSKYPQWARRVADEAQRVCGDGPVELHHVEALRDAGLVLQESMRLYPPIWTNERHPVEDDVIEGYAIPKTTQVAVSIWLLHRNPSVWDHPRRFDPERFLPERSAGRHKYAFIPFGIGPRVCVGNHLAGMQSKVVLATLARRVVIEVQDTDARASATITLRPQRLAGRFRRR